MADITINGTSYPLVFGMNFMREANKRVEIKDNNGAKQGIGLTYLCGGIWDGDLEDLEDCLILANKTEEPKLTRDILDDWIEDESTDVEEVLWTVAGFLSKANASKSTWNKIAATVDEAPSWMPPEISRKSTSK